jgi:hypothetical protein
MVDLLSHQLNLLMIPDKIKYHINNNKNMFLFPFLLPLASPLEIVLASIP